LHLAQDGGFVVGGAWSFVAASMVVVQKLFVFYVMGVRTDAMLKGAMHSHELVPIY
jgi:hypothetical protein